MFLKRIDGLRAITLPDGSVLSQADLPPSTTRRWVTGARGADGLVAGVLIDAVGGVQLGVLLAQFSLARAAGAVAERTRLPVLTTVGSAVARLRQRLG